MKIELCIKAVLAKAPDITNESKNVCKKRQNST